MEYLIYLVPLLVGVVWYVARESARARREAVVRARAAAAEGERRHPRIDAATCIGCGSCVLACPEQREGGVLGLVAGKAQLLNASACLGHGACRTACPVGAITLVPN